MTHISLSVSRRGGAQNDTLAWKIRFEGTCWGLRAARLGGNELILSFHRIFFCLHGGMWHSETLQLFLSQSASVPSLSAGRFVQLPVVMSRSILKSVPCPHKLGCCNSPGSCCPGELWWGYCWGWMRGCVPLWCGEPLRFLKRWKQFGEEGHVFLDQRLILAEAEMDAGSITCKIIKVALMAVSTLSVRS